jgi:hypothetical protein
VIATDAAPPPPRYNRLAVVGFALSLAAILVLILGTILLQFFFEQLEPNLTVEEQQKKAMEIASDPEYAGRFMLGVGSLCLSFVCWLAGLIVSGIAATRKDLAGRRLAIAGIACSVLCLLLFCSGSLF